MRREPNKLVKHVAILMRGANMNYAAQEFVSTSLSVGSVLAIAAFFFIYSQSILYGIVGGVVVFLIFELFIYITLSTASSRRMEAIEKALPEFLSVMASNIRAGHTHDHALMLSARKELGPLAEEIDYVSKETLTGTSLAEALQNMAHRIPSHSIEKTMGLIVKGLNSGGKLADLLDATSLDIRRFESIRREVDSTVMVYKLFSLAAVCIGAPLLYAVTGFLINVFAETKARIGTTPTEGAVGSLPFFQGAAISPTTAFYFSLAAIGVTVFFGSLVAGVISKGEERDGLIYIPVLAFISFSIFYIGSFLLNVLLGGFFFSHVAV